MSGDVANAYVSLIPSFRGGTSAISNALGGSVDGAGRDAGRRFGSGVLGGLGGMKGQITAVVGGMLAFQGAKAIFTAVKGSVVDFNSTLQQSGIAFTTMLGSAQKSQDFIGKLKDFAKSTPFEFEGLVSNTQTMLGMGVAAKDVIPYLTALGDSVASVGGDGATLNNTILAFSQTMAKGTLDMGNMNQLLQGGIPSALKVLAASYHVTTGEMVAMISSGKVQSSEALPKLVAGLEKGTAATAALGGMMDKQSHTFKGAMSNIADSFTQTMASAGKPFFDGMTSGAETLAALLGSPKVTAWASAFAKRTQAGMTSATHAVEDLYAGFTSGTATLPANASKFEVFGKRAFGVFVDARRAAEGLFAAVKPQVMANVSAIMSSLGQTVTVLKPYLDQLWAQFGPTLTAILPDLLQLAQALNPVSLIVHAILPVLPQLADAFGRIAVALANAILPILPTVVSLLASLTTIMSAGLQAALVAILPPLTTLLVIMAPLAPYVLALFLAFKGYQAAKAASLAVRGFASSAMVAAKANLWAAGALREWAVQQGKMKLAAAADGMKRFGSAALNGAKAAAGLVKSLALSAAGYVRTGAAAVASAAQLVAVKAAQLAVAAAAKAWAAAQWLLNAALSANPLTLIVIAIAAVVAIVVLAYLKVGWFRDLVQAAFGAVVAAGMALWAGLKAAFDAIVGAVTAVVGFVADHWKLLLAIFGGPLGLLVVLIVSNFGRIKAFIAAAIGFVLGIVRAVLGVIAAVWRGVWGTFTGVVSAVWGGVKSSVSGALGWVRDTIARVGKVISGAWSTIWGGFKKIVDGVFDGIKSTIKGIGNTIISVINFVIRSLNKLKIKIPKVHVPLGPTLGGQTLGFDIPELQSFADGGVIPATPGGRIIRVAEAGQAEVVAPIDKFLDAIGGNRGGDAPLIGSLTLNEVTDVVGTARAVTRRLAHLGAV